MLARQRYKDSLCPNCGQPKALAWHGHNEGQFEVTEVYTCHACTAMDRYGADKPEKVKPREYPVVSYTRPSDSELDPFPGGVDPRQPVRWD